MNQLGEGHIQRSLFQVQQASRSFAKPKDQNGTFPPEIRITYLGNSSNMQQKIAIFLVKEQLQKSNVMLI